MKPFSEPVMNYCAQRGVLDVGKDYSKDLELFVNNIIREQKYPEGHPQYRDENTIREHTAPGMGAECYLLLNNLFKQVSPAVNNAKSIPFGKRMQDLECEGRFIQVKSCLLHPEYGDLNWNISDTTIKSLLYSSKYCDVLMVIGYEKIAYLKYLYTPLWMIDIKELVKTLGYFRKEVSSTGKTYYRVDSSAARRRKILLDLCIL